LKFTYAVLLLGVLVSTGCSDDDAGGDDGGSCSVGGEGCPCTGGGACDPGLTCASDLCIDLGGGPGTDGGDHDGDAGTADRDGGDGDGDGDGDVGDLRIEAQTFAGTGPTYLVSGASASVQVWSDGSSSPSQILYKRHDDSVRTRVIFDSATGDLSRIIDEITGTYLIIVEHAGRLEFLEYDVDDQFLRGFALQSNGATFESGTLVGRPVISGQVQGQLATSEEGSMTGSFALIASTRVELDDAIDVTDDMNAWLKLGSGATAVSTFAGIGVSASPLINISRSLRFAGLVVAGVGLIAGAPAYGAAGVAMVIGGYFANDTSSFIRNKFASDNPFVQELVDLAASNLSDPSAQGLGDFLQNATDKVRSVLAGGGDGSDPALAATPFAQVDSYTEAAATSISTSFPEPIGGPPSVAVNVIGQAVFQDQSSFGLQGTIESDGTLDVQGSGPVPPPPFPYPPIPDAPPRPTELGIDIDGQIDTQQMLLGEYNRETFTETMENPYPGVVIETGSVTGQVIAIAQCEAVQQSGGQGTFTNAHFVGQGGGDSTFVYDAFDIRDAFTVKAGTNGFSTGGLVSGTGTAMITVDESGFVFVSVSAPESGTEWEYSLSCL
jgi:hypothetical protein